MSNTMPKTVYFKTYGCQMNEYDSQRMLDLLKSQYQAVLVDTPEAANFLLIMNTCSIREKAQEKVFSELGRWRALKKKQPQLLIAVAGCVAAQEGAEIIKRAPCVDVVFGPQTIHRLGAMLEETQQKKQPVVDISFPEIEKFDKLPQVSASGASGMITIMEGCSKYCSYCVVPYTRGPEIYRPFADVLHEAVTLTEQGVTDITLLGQNVNAYRVDMSDGSVADFAKLLRYLAQIDGVQRLQFTTSHPREFSANLIQAYAELPQLVNHVHLPVQSGSDTVLMRMKRGYTTLEYKAIIRRLRQVRPNITISSDFIVGFPGETDEEFAATMRLVKDIGFVQSYSFIYSARPGTPAAAYEDNVPIAVKKQRLQLLQAQLVESSRQHREQQSHVIDTIDR
jgi:tRNA-2-methylthio-N6-dimethylallyladenosine synthase